LTPNWETTPGVKNAKSQTEKYLDPGLMARQERHGGKLTRKDLLLLFRWG